VEDLTSDLEDGMYFDFGDAPSVDIFADLSAADERAFALFRSILEDAFAGMEPLPTKRARATKRKGTRAASSKKTSPPRKRATSKSPPARRISTSR
jgi:hypothetical protein